MRTVRVCVDRRGQGWRVDGLGPDVARRRFATLVEAERCALERLDGEGRKDELVVQDAYRRVIHRLHEPASR